MDIKKRNAFAARNEALVWHVLKTYFPAQRPYWDDLYGAGAFALVRAVEGYIEGRAAFTTYACRAIFNAVVRELPNVQGTGRVSEVSRRHARRTGRHVGELEQMLKTATPLHVAEQPAACSGAEQRARAAERRELFEIARDELARDRDGQLALRHLLADVPQVQMAGELGYSKQRVQQRIRDALRRTRARLSWLEPMTAP